MLRWLRSVLQTADLTARHDLALFRGSPRFVAAIAVFLVIPALYAAIYLSSLWDPAALTRNLTVLLVDQDEGTVHEGRPVRLGRGIVEDLARDTRFTYKVLAEPSLAVAEVDHGAAVFAVLIPPDFSRRAMEASQIGTARFTVHASEGNNASSAAFAQRFAVEVSERVNQSINEQRFDAMLQAAGGSSASLAQLRAAMAQLGEGSAQLAQGSRRTRDAAARLVEGLQQLDQAGAPLEQGVRTLDQGARQMAEGLARTGSAVGAMRSRLPEDTDLAQLREAAAQLAAAQQRLAAALRELESGAQRLSAGHGEMVNQAGSVPFVGDALADGAQKLQAGAEQLRAGLALASTSAAQLQAGGIRLSEGVSELTQGVGAAAGGLAQLDAALPPAAVLEQATTGGPRLAAATARVAQGSDELATGGVQLQQALTRLDEATQKLAEGIAQLQARLPSPPTPPEGTAAGLSESVKPVLQFSARVPNQGTAMAPYFVPLSLWVGATLCAVLFAYHRLPRPLVGRPRLGIVLGKLCVPGVVMLVQSALLAGLLLVLLNVQVAHPGRFVTTLVLTSLTFGALLMVLVQLFGSAGKLVAVILLALQLAASGTMVPIELTSRFFQALHPWLPLTWSIKATRIAMFDAYGGAWMQSIGAMVAMLGAALLVATLVGRWKAVEPHDYRPMLD